MVGKIVRIVDLKDFFTIQNNELKIKVEEINSKRYSYTFGGFTFIVDIEEVEKPKSSYLNGEIEEYIDMDGDTDFALEVCGYDKEEYYAIINEE